MFHTSERWGKYYYCRHQDAFSNRFIRLMSCDNATMGTWISKANEPCALLSFLVVVSWCSNEYMSWCKRSLYFTYHSIVRFTASRHAYFSYFSCIHFLHMLESYHANYNSHQLDIHYQWKGHVLHMAFSCEYVCKMRLAQFKSEL